MPGATALIPAIVNSGLSSERFVFEGFLPAKKGRKKRIKSLIDEKRSIIIYESPKKMIKLLIDLIKFLGDERKASVSREISKIYQENIRGTLKELYDKFEISDIFLFKKINKEYYRLEYTFIFNNYFTHFSFTFYILCSNLKFVNSKYI